MPAMKGKVALISGTSIERSSVFEGWRRVRVETTFGEVMIREFEGLIVVNRHGFDDPVPPHSINYRAYVAALKDAGVESAICLNSVGSLRDSLLPGTLVSCDDYLSFSPMTFFDDRLSGFAPVLDNSLLGDLRRVCPHPIEMGKVYAQTRGPRFETKAEVRVLQSWGCDVVGMTFANEADLLLEAEIGVTSICMIDNFAHGIDRQQLSMEQFRSEVRQNQMKVDVLLQAVVHEFAKRA